jgi:hypothetical protein
MTMAAAAMITAVVMTVAVTSSLAPYALLMPLLC